MRILAIGLGGAGGRIVNHLYRTDRRSSKVACVQALAVDVDEDAIKRLTDLPENAKIFFPPLDIARPEEDIPSRTATIDIAEIAARAQTMSTGETDAVFLVMGLGGSMADDVPSIITTLRSSMTEPIFALVTLPCLSEGARCSAKAADQIEMISPLVDGIILFDNETWHKKVKIAEKLKPASDQGFASKLGLKKKKEPTLSPEERMHAQLNDVIIRRISLILRAGEFRADGGLDLAEVVLDAGEVLNTMKGMGFITIGYAVEQLPSRPLDFLTKLRPSTGYFADEDQKKASRIIELAKQAIYHEISAPCDITSAHKALVLVAGPSHELSMKGFMTVRKWIDRSIAGLETRSGDYPVMSTRFVAIIIMLTGLENVPRISELKEIRAETQERIPRSARNIVIEAEERERDISLTVIPPKARRDEVIPVTRDTGVKGRSETRHTKQEPVPDAGPEYDLPHQPSAQRPVVSAEPVEDRKPRELQTVRRPDAPSDSIRKLLKSRQVQKKGTDSTGLPGDRDRTVEEERQRIAEDLEKQRRIAFGGGKGQEPFSRKLSHHEEEYATIKTQEEKTSQPRGQTGSEEAPVKQVLVRKQTGKKVVIHRKSGAPSDMPGEDASREIIPFKKPSPDEAGTLKQSPAQVPEHELLDDWIQQVKEQKNTLRSEEESGPLTIDDVHGAVTRDEALVRTNKKRGSGEIENPNKIAGIKRIDPVREIEPAGKKRNRTKDDEDLSFVG